MPSSGPSGPNGRSLGYSALTNPSFTSCCPNSERGDIAPLPNGGGATAKLTEAGLIALTDLVAEPPDATLEELCQQLKKKAGNEVSQSTICRGLQTLTLTVKKGQTRR